MLDRLKWLLPALTLFMALVLLSASGRQQGGGSSLAALMLEIVGPAENLLTSSARGVENVWRNYFYLADVRRENEIMREVIDRQARQIIQLNEYKAANERLTGLLEFREANPAFVSRPARVLAWDPGPWFRSVIINLGSLDGAAVDQAVVHSSGVVGRIVEATPHFARVLLATDFNSSIDAFVQRSRAVGILSGQGGAPFILKYVRKDEDVRPGDLVVTSGLDGFFPKGLALGSVSRVERQGVEMFVSVEVVPVVPFDRLEEVLVIIDERPPLDWLSLAPRLRPLTEDIADERSRAVGGN
ncbi:MAG: rod shape-determining protein MreC [Candidatus Adiutrix sp.]|jgi:rod shape-determining protein MreC|nr:rod shape-determining protein MreC [Candidatus Adiutrix sp.]